MFQQLLTAQHEEGPLDGVNEPTQVMHAVLSCRDLHAAWKQVVLQPEQHGLLPWLATAIPTRAVDVVLKLGTPDPAAAIKALVIAVDGKPEILSK